MFNACLIVASGVQSGCYFAEQRRLAVATTTVETGKKMLKLKQ
jgi:hypothetical protein